MALPLTEIVTPVLRVPFVASDALTVEVRAIGSPFPELARFRAFLKDTAPPAWHEKELVKRSALETAYFTWGGFVNGKTYTIQAQSVNSDGDSTVVQTEVSWTPELDLYPGASPAFDVLERPWSWEDYAGDWLGLLPWYYQSEPFTNALLERIGQEFERLSAAIEAVERFAMPSRTYSEGMKRWEAILDINPPDSYPDDRRRAMVLAHLRGRVDASAALFLHSLTHIMGTTPRVLEDFNGFTVLIDTTQTPEIQTLIEEVIHRILPAHLVAIYNPATMLLDYPERRAPIPGVWPRGRATQRPDGFRPGGFDSGGLA